MSLPPGPSAPPAVQTVRWALRPMGFMDACRRRFGDVFSVSFVGFKSPMVMISDPESIKALYTSGESGLPPGGEAGVMRSSRAAVSLMSQAKKSPSTLSR